MSPEARADDHSGSLSGVEIVDYAACNSDDSTADGIEDNHTGQH
jgi:hypothetical protein